MTNESGLSRKQRILLVLAGVALVLLLPIIVSAISSLTSPYTATENVTYEASDGPVITLGTDLESDASEPFPDANTVDMSPHAEFYSNGTTNATVDQFGTDDGETTILSELDVQDNTLEVDVDGKRTVTIQGDANRLAYDDLAVDEGNVMTVSHQDPGTASEQSTITIDGISEDYVAVVGSGSNGEELLTHADATDGAVEFTVPNDLGQDVDIELVASSGPTIDEDSATPTGPLSQAPNELSVEISDGVSGADEEIEARFYLNGDYVGTDSITGDGTVSTTVDPGAGEHEWTVEVTDSVGQTDEASFTFSTPSDLEVRDEITGELINSDVEVEITFYESGAETVVTRTTSNGTIDMTGLPAGRELIIEGNADGYYTRTTIIEEIAVQSTMYLLDDNETSRLTEFEISDRTTSFPASETRLYVQKAINDSDDESSTFRTIAGDHVGANGRVDMELRADDRYRLVVENDDGDQRVLGDYVANRAELVELEIGTIELEAPDDRGFSFNAGMADAEKYGENVVEIRFNDPNGQTDELRYTIHDVQNESDIVHGEVVINDPGQVVERVEVPENKTVAVSWEVKRGGETYSGTENVGSVGPLNLPVSGLMLQVLGISALILLAGLFGGRLSRMGAVVIVVMAWGMRIIGIVVVPYPFLVAAGIVALLFAVGDGRSSSGGVPPA